MKQCLILNLKWRHKRNFLLHQFHRERMFFEDRIIAPAARAIKFYDDIVILRDAYLVHTVFIAVEGKKSTVAFESKFFERLENVVWLKCSESEGTVVDFDHMGATVTG